MIKNRLLFMFSIITVLLLSACATNHTGGDKANNLPKSSITVNNSHYLFKATLNANELKNITLTKTDHVTNANDDTKQGLKIYQIQGNKKAIFIKEPQAKTETWLKYVHK